MLSHHSSGRIRTDLTLLNPFFEKSILELEWRGNFLGALTFQAEVTPMAMPIAVPDLVIEKFNFFFHSKRM